MNHFTTYHVHLYNQVAAAWTEEHDDELAALIEDDVLCGLLEAVTVLYLRQRGPMGRDLIVGAQNPYAPTAKDYERPFMTHSLDFDARPMLRRMLASLDAMAGDSAPAKASRGRREGYDRAEGESRRRKGGNSNRGR